MFLWQVGKMCLRLLWALNESLTLDCIALYWFIYWSSTKGVMLYLNLMDTPIIFVPD